jgi:hypothetical protein
MTSDSATRLNPPRGEKQPMTQEEVLQAAMAAKERGIPSEITQKGELVYDEIVWPGRFSIWLQNPRTRMVHRLDEFCQAMEVLHHEDEIKAAH